MRCSYAGGYSYVRIGSYIFFSFSFVRKKKTKLHFSFCYRFHKWRNLVMLFHYHVLLVNSLALHSVCITLTTLSIPAPHTPASPRTGLHAHLFLGSSPGCCYIKSPLNGSLPEGRCYLSPPREFPHDGAVMFLLSLRLEPSPCPPPSSSSA